MLEKYHYITFFKRCKKILDDGEVSPDEIDSLKGGYVESAQSETRAVHEALDSRKRMILFLVGSTLLLLGMLNL